MPTHRKILLWATFAAAAFCALQVGWRVWLSRAGEAVVGEVTVASDRCRSHKRANCFLGRAVVNPRMKAHPFSTTKVPGGRFYTVGDTVAMRVYPHPRFYLAAVYTPIDWLLGPARSAAVAALLLFTALVPARWKALWIAPLVVVLFLVFG